MASHIKISSTESSQEHCVKLNWKMAEVASLGTSGILPSTFLKSILSNWFWSVIWLSYFKLDLNSGILFPSCPKYPPHSWWFILLAISVVSVSWHATCMGSCVITPSWPQSTSFYLIYPAPIKWVPLSVLYHSGKPAWLFIPPFFKWRHHSYRGAISFGIFVSALPLI